MFCHGPVSPKPGRRPSGAAYHACPGDKSEPATSRSYRAASDGGSARPPDRFDLGLGQVFDSKSLAVPARGMSRCVMKCHEVSCSAAPRPSPPPRRSSARLHPACRSSIVFRSRRRRFPGSATPFRAYRMCACVRSAPARLCAPDCAREPNAGRTPPVRSQHRNALPSLPGIEKAAPEAASSRLFVFYHTFPSVKPPAERSVSRDNPELHWGRACRPERDGSAAPPRPSSHRLEA